MNRAVRGLLIVGLVVTLALITIGVATAESPGAPWAGTWRNEKTETQMQIVGVPTRTGYEYRIQMHDRESWWLCKDGSTFVAHGWGYSTSDPYRVGFTLTGRCAGRDTFQYNGFMRYQILDDEIVDQQFGLWYRIR
jgi:hypothetical protein